MRFFATFKSLLERKETKIGRLFSFACLIFLESKYILVLEFNIFRGPRDGEEGEIMD